MPRTAPAAAALGGLSSLWQYVASGAMSVGRALRWRHDPETMFGEDLFPTDQPWDVVFDSLWVSHSEFWLVAGPGADIVSTIPEGDSVRGNGEAVGVPTFSSATDVGVALSVWEGPAPPRADEPVCRPGGRRRSAPGARGRPARASTPASGPAPRARSRPLNAPGAVHSMREWAPTTTSSRSARHRR